MNFFDSLGAAHVPREHRSKNGVPNHLYVTEREGMFYVSFWPPSECWFACFPVWAREAVENLTSSLGYQDRQVVWPQPLTTP